MKWYQLLKYRNVQAMCLGFFILNYILYFFITWFPTYLVEERGMQFSQMGMAASVPFIAAVCGSLIAGILADKLLM
ncbi:MFS transporter, partial [Acinetobacter baumannii]